jgi:hypothetical protein
VLTTIIWCATSCAAIFTKKTRTTARTWHHTNTHVGMVLVNLRSSSCNGRSGIGYSISKHKVLELSSKILGAAMGISCQVAWNYVCVCYDEVFAWLNILEKMHCSPGHTKSIALHKGVSNNQVQSHHNPSASQSDPNQFPKVTSGRNLIFCPTNLSEILKNETNEKLPYGSF